MMDMARARELIEEALIEDLDGVGDITSSSLMNNKVKAKAEAVAKEDGVICGTDMFKLVFSMIDENLDVEWLVADGDRIESGATIAIVTGSACKILSGERIALNFLQHMSGIATLTAAFVNECRGTKAKILDTRKTLPGLRDLEKYAVRVGGGENHRFGLYDAILIKDNHISACGGIVDTIERVRKRFGDKYTVELEVSSPEQAVEAAPLDIDIMMFDNFSLDEIKRAMESVDTKAEIEVSGGVMLQNVREIALTGIDRISIGALTQSAKALDISLDFATDL